MSPLPSHVQLNSKHTSIIIAFTERQPNVVYWGSRLNEINFSELATLSFRQEAKCSSVNEPVIALTPCYGQGFTGAVGLEISGESQQWSWCGDIVSVENTQSHQAHQLKISTRY